MPTDEKKQDGRRNNGRKPKFEMTAEIVKQIERAAGLGLNVEDIAHILGMSKATFDRKRKQKKFGREINEALERGRFNTRQKVAAALVSRATGMKHPAVKVMKTKDDKPLLIPYERIYPPDPKAAQFYLQTQGGWKPTVAHEHSGSIDAGAYAIAAAVSNMTDDELAERERVLKAKAEGKKDA